MTRVKHVGYPEESKHLITVRYYYSEGLLAVFELDGNIRLGAKY